MFPFALRVSQRLLLIPFLSLLAFGSLQSATSSSTLLNTLTSDESWFRYYTPGIIRPDQGTIEFTFVPTKPPSEFGAHYDFAFLIVPAQESSARTLMGLHIPPTYHPSQGWNFICRNESKTGTVHFSKLDFQVGQPIRVACSWGSELKLYLNGKLVASQPYSRLVSPLPALFSVRRGAPFNTQGLRVSSVPLPEDRLAGDPQKEFTADADTTLLVTDHLQKIETFQTPWHTQSNYAAATPVWDVTSQNYLAGQEVRYPVTGINRSGTPQTFQISQTVTPYPTGKAIETKHTWDIPTDSAYHINDLPLPDLKAPGFFKVKTTITPPQGNPKSWSSSLAVFPALPAGSKEGTLARYLGHHHDLDYDLNVMEQVGIHSTRTMDQFKWFNVEPIQGQFRWTETDAVIAKAKKANHELLVILSSPPHWASEDPGDELKKKHQNAAMFERWKPRDIKQWENYIYQTVSRYKGSVKYWEIWNEVDFHPPGLPAAFSGSTEDYRNLLKSAYTQIKKADPNAQVLTSGFSLSPSVCDAAMPYDLFKMGAADSFDIFNVHAYNGLLYIDALSAALDQVKPNTPRWMTEQMWNTITNEKTRVYLDVAIVLWYLEKKYDRFFAFGFDEMHFSHHSLSPTVDFFVLGVLQNQLRQTNQFNGRLTFPGSEEYSVRHTLTRTDGKTLTVLGSEISGHEITMEGNPNSATDLWGQPIALETHDGKTKLKVATIAYLVSDKPLKILTSEATEATPLYVNGGFEDVQGDIAMGGLAVGKPVGWTFRETVKDPQGKITLTDTAHSGKFGIKVHSSGKGAVYAFQYTTLPIVGTYRVTAHLKLASEKDSGTPYLSLYDMASGRVYQQPFPNVKSNEWVECSYEVTFDVMPEKQVAFMAGLQNGAGDLLVDDVTFVRVPAGK